LLEGAAEKLLISSPKQVQHFLFGTGVSMVSDTPVGGMGIPTGGIERTPSGAYSVGGDIIDKLCGKNPESGEKGCGTAFGHLGQDGCIGLSNYSKAKDIGKQVGAFLLPLQKHGASGRVHTSLNLKTTTGRLVSSNPNLQQLPALDKDVYKVREAVRAPEGKKFIIADYGQLDLRVLAHMSRSKNMIEALCGGLDIHSATALNMYDYVKEALDNGDVCLEKQADKPDVPLLKDVYGSERRNAKAVNFGIAYGLTKFGLARQLDCSQEDAEYMIEKWYAAYPEVRDWKDIVVSEAIAQGKATDTVPRVTTLRGRSRPLQHLRRVERVNTAEEVKKKGYMKFFMERNRDKDDWKQRGNAERQATNTPIQGGSADIVVEAMLKASVHEELLDLGYHIILQIHDELVFEGPEEHAERALQLVKEVMEDPFLDGLQLRVPLPVDAKIADTWAEGK
jgi:DNA polymerase-1